MNVYDNFPELPNDTYRVSYGFSEKLKTNTVMVQFGDGYQQIIPVGKNYKKFEFEASWNNVRYNFTNDINNKEVGNIIHEFLVAHQDIYPFWFRKLPNEERRLVLAQEVSLSHNLFDLVSISCKLVEFKGFGDRHSIGEIINGRFTKQP